MTTSGITVYSGDLTGSSATTPVAWNGGRSTLTINASQYGTGLQLVTKMPNGTWLPICSSFISDQIFAFDAPAGQYGLVNQSGSSVSVGAALTTTPYR